MLKDMRTMGGGTATDWQRSMDHIHQQQEPVMSRRSILLATTVHVAIGWLAAVGPASAHDFALGAGQSSLSFVARSPAYGNISRAPFQSMSNSMGNPGETRFGHAPSSGEPAAAGSN